MRTRLIVRILSFVLGVRLFHFVLVLLTHYLLVSLVCTRPLRSTPDLREELVHVQNLLRDEQSMHQTSNQALNLVVEAQNEELKHARSAAGAKHSTEDELKEFDIKAKEYDEAMKEVKEKEVKKKKGSGAPHKWIF